MCYASPPSLSPTHSMSTPRQPLLQLIDHRSAHMHKRTDISSHLLKVQQVRVLLHLVQLQPHLRHQLLLIHIGGLPAPDAIFTLDIPLVAKHRDRFAHLDHDHRGVLARLHAQKPPLRFGAYPNTPFRRVYSYPASLGRERAVFAARAPANSPPPCFESGSAAPPSAPGPFSARTPL